MTQNLLSERPGDILLGLAFGAIVVYHGHVWLAAGLFITAWIANVNWRVYWIRKARNVGRHYGLSPRTRGL